MENAMNACLCERYTLYLLLEPSRHSDADIILELKDRGLDVPRDEDLKRLRHKHPPPSNFQPRARQNLASQKFLRALGITKLFFPDATTRRAFDLLDSPKAREWVESFLLSGTTPPQISKILKHKLGKTYSVPVIEAFTSFFFDTSRLDRTGLKVAIMERLKTRYGIDPKEDAAARNDPRVAALTFPRTRAAARFLATRLGIPVSNANLREMMEELTVVAGLSSYEAVLAGSVADARRAHDLIQVACQAHELSRMCEIGTDAIYRAFSGLRLETDDSRIPHISELGEHTVDLQPVGAHLRDVVEVEEEA
jgi:hypothetical protein